MTLRDIALLALHGLVWGSAYILIAVALEAFSVGQLAFARCALATVTLAIILQLRGHSLRAVVREVKERPLASLALALSGTVLPFLFIAFGQRTVPAGLTGVLMASVPLWTALLALRLDRDERIAPRQSAGLLVGLAGVALVVGVEAVDTLPQAIGVIAILLGAGCYAATAFIAKRRRAEMSPARLGLVTLGVSSVLLLPLGASGGAFDPALGPIVAIVLLATIGTALGMTLMLKLTGELGPRRAALSSYLAPAFALILAALVLGEPITPAATLGLVLIVAGVAVASRSRRVALAVDSARPERVPAPASPLRPAADGAHAV